MSFHSKHFFNPSEQGTIRPLFLSAADFGWLEEWRGVLNTGSVDGVEREFLENVH